MTGFDRLPDESDFEFELRLCLAKTEHKLNTDWCDIADILGWEGHTDTLRKMAYGYKRYHDYLMERSSPSAALKILSLSDIHFPFTLPIEKLSAAGKVDILQLNGDLLDCQSLSKFPKAFRVNPIEEMIEGRRYLLELIKLVSPKKVVINYGNHDVRLQNYMSKHVDAGIVGLMPTTPLEYIFVDGFHYYDKRNSTKTWYEPLGMVLSDMNICVEYRDTWYTQIGKTIFCHPLAYSNTMMKTARDAMQYFKNEGYDFDSLVMAHTHRVGYYSIGSTRIYEQGAFCDTSKHVYMDGRLANTQKEGFILVCQDVNGSNIPEQTKIFELN